MRSGFAVLRPWRSLHTVRPEQENKQVLQVANAASLGTKLLVLPTKHNTHEQWDKHNQVKYRGTLGGISNKRHLRSLKNNEKASEG